MKWEEIRQRGGGSGVGELKGASYEYDKKNEGNMLKICWSRCRYCLYLCGCVLANIADGGYYYAVVEFTQGVTMATREDEWG